LPQLISLNNRTFSVSNIIGIWNIYNITASMVVATLFNIPLEDNIKLYKPKRRLEVIYDKSDTLILDDYAVHPTEITAVVGACLQLYKEDNLYVIWQPHRLSRLKRLHERFKESFSLLKKENLFIFPIYEVNITSYTEEEWMELIDYGKFIKDRDLPTLIRQLEGKVILLLTAGDLNYKVKSIINDL
jgi:UDP-N-acetylmuramate--alanine ligase